MKGFKDEIHKLFGIKNRAFEMNFTGGAFITFDTQEDMRKAVQLNQRKILGFTLQKGIYRLERAHEPEDIIWENYGPSRS